MLWYGLNMIQSFWRKTAFFVGLQDPLSWTLFSASAALFLANAAVVAHFLIGRWGNLGFLRLRHTVAFGIDWVGDWRWIMLFPALGLLMLLANGALAGRLFRRHRRLGVMALFLTVMVEAAVAAAALIAISLNA